ncbi:unnamed protein product [Rhizophagus irregularis]|nr:unnamed protein product [Rhizophagus irregularis]
MINSAMSLRNSRSQSIDPFYYYQKNNAAFIDKRKFYNSIEDGNDNDQNSKRRKLFGNENSEYFTKEIELDINKNLNEPQNNEYVTKEFYIDINNILIYEILNLFVLFYLLYEYYGEINIICSNDT